MASDGLRVLGRLADAAFRLEILVMVAIFGVVLGYFVYGQLLTVVTQIAAIVGGVAVGLLCAGGLAYLAVTMEW